MFLAAMATNPTIFSGTTDVANSSTVSTFYFFIVGNVPDIGLLGTSWF